MSKLGDEWDDACRDCDTCINNDDRMDTDQPCVACEYLIEEPPLFAVRRSHWEPRTENHT